MGLEMGTKMILACGPEYVESSEWSHMSCDSIPRIKKGRETIILGLLVLHRVVVVGRI